MYLAVGEEEQSLFGGRFFHVPRSREDKLVASSIEKLAIVSTKRGSFENAT